MNSKYLSPGLQEAEVNLIRQKTEQDAEEEGRQAASGQPPLPEKAISHLLLGLPAGLCVTRPSPTTHAQMHTRTILFVDKTQNNDSKNNSVFKVIRRSWEPHPRYLQNRKVDIGSKRGMLKMLAGPPVTAVGFRHCHPAGSYKIFLSFIFLLF